MTTPINNTPVSTPLTPESLYPPVRHFGESLDSLEPRYPASFGGAVAFREHPHHGDESPPLAVHLPTGIVLVAGYYDREDYDTPDHRAELAAHAQALHDSRTEPTPEPDTLTPEAVASVMEACIAVEEGVDGFSPAAQRDLRLAFQESQARGEDLLENLTNGLRSFYADVLGLLGYDLIDLSFEERARGIGTALCDAALLLVGDGYRLAAPEPTPEDTTPALTSQDCPRCDGGTESPDAWGCLDCNGVGRVLAPTTKGARLTPSYVREMIESTGLVLHTEPDTLKNCGTCGGQGCGTCGGDGVVLIPTEAAPDFWCAHCHGDGCLLCP